MEGEWPYRERDYQDPKDFQDFQQGAGHGSDIEVEDKLMSEAVGKVERLKADNVEENVKAIMEAKELIKFHTARNNLEEVAKTKRKFNFARNIRDVKTADRIRREEWISAICKMGVSASKSEKEFRAREEAFYRWAHLHYAGMYSGRT